MPQNGWHFPFFFLGTAVAGARTAFSPSSGPVVCVRKSNSLALRALVRKPNPLALRAVVRKPCRRPGHLFRSFRCPGLRTKTEFIGFAGRRTQTAPAPGPAAKCIFARTPAGLFAPPCPQILMPSFRGAKTPAAVPNRCRGFSISLFLCYILISSMPAFPHTHRRCTAYP